MRKRTGLVGYQAFRPTPKREVIHTFEPPRRTDVGGVRAGWWNATYPLVTLSVDGDWARISIGFGLRSIWIARSEVWQVRYVRAWLSSGIMFDATDDAFAGVVYWTFSANRVLRMFAEAGWPTESPAGPLGRPPA